MAQAIANCSGASRAQLPTTMKIDICMPKGPTGNISAISGATNTEKTAAMEQIRQHAISCGRRVIHLNATLSFSTASSAIATYKPNYALLDTGGDDANDKQSAMNMIYQLSSSFPATHFFITQ